MSLLKKSFSKLPPLELLLSQQEPSSSTSSAKNSKLVPLKKMIERYQKQNLDYDLPILLGVDSSNKDWFADLTKVGHILMAGSTGSGKSSFVHSVLASMLFLLNARQVKFLLIDMKRVEFSVYEGIPHLLTKPLVDANKVFNQLSLLLEEKKNRLEMLELKNVQMIQDYHQRYSQEKMPYIVVLIDTFSDLMLADPQRFERLVTALAADYKKSGIHIVMLDSRFSDDVFTPNIRSSFPAKICFAVSDKRGSQLLVGDPRGADLTGQGDLLYRESDGAELIRLQAPFISYREIARLRKFFKKQE